MRGLLLLLTLLCLAFSAQSTQLLKKSSLVQIKKDSKSIETKFDLKNDDTSTDVSAPATVVANQVARAEFPQWVKLIIGAGGIYAAFLYYGSLQEDVTSFKSPSGHSFKQAWFLMAIEALANVIIGGIGLLLTGGSVEKVPQKLFAMCGTAQVFAKACTTLSLANKVSFPVVTLAKSGKMVPVMIGSILIGNAKYTLREYASVFAIILGTCIVSMDKKKKSVDASSPIGLAYIIMSLVFDGITGGLQKKIKVEGKNRQIRIKPYDLMFWNNLYMSCTAIVMSIVLGELAPGIAYCVGNPIIMSKIGKYALMSAIGQSFIFYTIANFEPLVCTTITTTRKVFSVLLSIFKNGHPMSTQGWMGIVVASGGILSELQDKSSSHKPASKPADDEKKNSSVAE